ncbi:MAG: hypothetical protein ACI4W2_03470 [Eubacterium sp.]
MDIHERIEKNRKPIRISIVSEDELYEPYDPDKNELAASAFKYIISRVDMELLEGKERTARNLLPQIQIISNDKVDISHFKRAFCFCLDSRIEQNNRKLKDNRKQEYGLFIFTVLLFLLSAVCAGAAGGIISTIFAAVGAFTSFELCDFTLFQDRNYKLENRALGQLKNIYISKG